MSHRSEYQIGDLLQITVEFTNIAGAPANPTLIDFLIRDPSGNVATLTQVDASNPATGTWVWMMPAAFNRAGTWRFRAVGKEGVVTAVERTASVGQSLFG